jgi:hypothetical protein
VLRFAKIMATPRRSTKKQRDHKKCAVTEWAPDGHHAHPSRCERGAHRDRNSVSILLQCCDFEISLTHTLAICRKKRSKSSAAIWIKLSINFPNAQECAQQNGQSASTPRSGRGLDSLEDLASGVDVHAREQPSAADHRGRFGRGGDDVVL